MAIIYTSTSSHKKQKRKPGWQKAEAEHRAWLIKMGIDPDRKQKKKEFKPLIVKDSYRRDTPEIPSAVIKADPNACALKDTSYKLEVSKQYVVGQAYNKGNYQVLSKAEQADGATGKRRF